MLRAPNGVIEDNFNYWAAGKALYDPGKITVPTVILHAEWDADLPSYLARAYFAQLKNAPVQASHRVERRHAYGHDGKESHAIFSRIDEFPRRGKTSCFEVRQSKDRVQKAG